MSSAGDSGSQSSSSSSDEEDNLVIGESEDKAFYRTLSCLKKKDPLIYDNNVTFFNEIPVSDIKKPKKEDGDKPIYINEYERTLVEEENTSSDNEKKKGFSQTYASVQKKIKNEMKSIVEHSSDDSDNEESSLGGLLKKKQKAEKEEEKEEATYLQWLKGQTKTLGDENLEKDLKPLRDYWNQPDLDEGEQFLKDYILNKRFLQNDAGDEEQDGSALSEDEKICEAQEEYEYKYNLRFETIKRFPRDIEGSLRRKDDRRKKKRQEIKERKKEEKAKKQEDIKKNQKLKIEEIKLKVEKLKEITGNDQLGFTSADILEDFDPEEYDKKMSKCFNDEYYSKDDEMPEFSSGHVWNEIEEDFIDTEDTNWDNDTDFNMDCEAKTEPGCSSKKSTRTKNKKKKRKNFKDISSAIKPIFDPQVHESYKKYIDEYYSLDCEDFIDDLPCKFKYRTVQANDFGLSIDEILNADDKELNKWCDIKKIQTLRPEHVEKNEVKIYAKKANDDILKKKILPSLYKSENISSDSDAQDEASNENVEKKPGGTVEIMEDDMAKSEQEKKKNGKLKKSGKKVDKVETNNIHMGSTEGNVDTQNQFKRKRKMNKFTSNDGPNVKRSKNRFNKKGQFFKSKSSVSDQRLSAYGLKSKKIKKRIFENL